MMVKINRLCKLGLVAEEVIGGETLAASLKGGTWWNIEIIRVRYGGSGRADLYRVISTSRRPSRRHKAPDLHVLSWRTRLVDLWAELMVAGRSHISDSAARIPIRSDCPIVSQADFRSYPAPCTCDHTADSVHFLELETTDRQSA